MRTRLIECRGKKSRTEVAKDLGITRQMVGYLERGDRKPSLSLAKKIADYYNLSIDEIFFDNQRNDMFLKNKKIS